MSKKKLEMKLIIKEDGYLGDFIWTHMSEFALLAFSKTG